MEPNTTIEFRSSSDAKWVELETNGRYHPAISILLALAYVDNVTIKYTYNVVVEYRIKAPHTHEYTCRICGESNAL